MKKIKILQITAVDITVKYLLLPLIDRFTEEGFEVRAVCSSGPYLESLLKMGYKISAIRIDRKISPVSNIRSLVSIYRLIRNEKFDIVHVHSPVAGAIGRIAAKLAGVPIIIYTAHGFYFHERMNIIRRKAFILIEKCMGRFFTDMLFTQSREDMKTALNEGIISKGKIEWISNGVDPAKFMPGRGDESFKDVFGIIPEDRIIGYVGRLVREKGIAELLFALTDIKKKIPQVKLLIVGDSLKSERDRSAKEVFQNIVDENGLANNIVFTGLVEDISGVYGLMDVFVLPSHREGMPRSILEAMASGIPVVATNIRGCREEVADGVTGKLVPVNDNIALSEAIKEILLNKEFADRMGLTARKVVLENFDERSVLDKELRVYRKLINEKINSSNG